jgi:hypothetical protein
MMIRNALAVVWLTALLLGEVATLGDEKDSASQTKKVAVVIDYGDGVEKHFTAIEWKEGLTVLDAMRAAQSHKRGIRFEQRGSGDTALLTKIDDLANEGRGRNWIYRVNGKLGDTSFGARKLEAGDSVLWKFEEYR